ncbi:hypothetical protein PLICRDRAFT_104019 [Plicaturopsis crispa FD-325 SS-3]|nr:hypothetical protein PLICRDRAFT_104019 [Plicaturopsis crispa FD-325 SS-3]
MASKTLILTSNNVVLPDYDSPQPATIIVDTTTGKIADIQLGVHLGDDDQDVQQINAGDNFILPGLVDAHVHLNEPGRTDWEGFWTGTRAAASGGVTTVVDMPLNSIPPTTTVDHLRSKREAALGQCWTDVAFWGGVIPGNEPHLKPLVDAGVKGFKCFLIESGVEEFPCVTKDDLVKSMKELQGGSTVLLFHAELDDSSGAGQAHGHEDPTAYSTFLGSRPQKLETDAIALITSLQRTYPDLRCHIVHLSASSALPLVRAAKSSGLDLTVETCFHYLCLSADDIPHGRPDFKCCPPIRETPNRDELWTALQTGVIDCVVSDHSPCVAGLKNMSDGDIMKAWGGISTLGLGLSLLWTEGRKRGATINHIVDWTCVKTAKHAGLEDRKGQLKVGHDADIVIWDPRAEFTVTKESLNFKNKLSPYEGMTLYGVVETTFLRGREVYTRATAFDGAVPRGILL